LLAIVHLEAFYTLTNTILQKANDLFVNLHKDCEERFEQLDSDGYRKELAVRIE
jgi:hypothetical protein